MPLVQKEVKAVYIGSRQVRPEAPTPPFTPGANTVAYYPLVSDGVDYSNNGNDLTAVGTPTYTTVGGASVTSFYSSSGSEYLYTQSATGLPQGNSDRTVSCWFYKSGSNGNDGAIFMLGSASYNNMFSAYIVGGTNNLAVSEYGSTSGNKYTLTDYTWYNIVVTFSSNTWSVYVNGVLAGTWSYGINTSGSNIYLTQGSWSSYSNCVGNLSEVIIEDVAWTAQEVLDYYNASKSIYGIN